MSQEENVFYQDDAVLITNARAVLGGNTYSMANITSVIARTRPAKLVLGIIIAAVGLVPATCCGCSTLGFLPLSGDPEFILASLITSGASLAGAIFWLLVVAGGVILAVRAKPTYIVVIGTAGGESEALSSKDSGYVNTIVRALNEAIIHRGQTAARPATGV